MMEAANTLAGRVGIAPACQALGVPRGSFYRRRAACEEQLPRQEEPRPKPKRALSDEEKIQVRDVLNSERFQDTSPRQV